MPVPAALSELSTTPSSNYPTGSEPIGSTDDYLRFQAACLAQLRESLAGKEAAGTAEGIGSAVRADLASTAVGKGAALLGHKGSRSVAARLAESPNAKDSNIVMDGATDDTSAWSTLLGTPRVEVDAPAGSSLVTAAPTNVYGPRIGPGRVLLKLNVNGDTRLLNSEADWFRHVGGQEYLYAAHAKLQARSAFNARFCGDSTTFGDYVVSASNKIHALTAQLVADRGFFISATNAGHSGANTEQWRQYYLGDDIAAAPDIMVIRYGINDPAYTKSNFNLAGTANAWTAEQSGRRDIADYASSLRAALQTIRAARDVSQTSIILMVPNSCSDSPNGRDEKWFEAVRGVVRQAARDFQCAYIDTYSLWWDARQAAGRWMDNPFGDGRAIHPVDIMNVWIASAISELLVPSGLTLRNALATTVMPTVGDAPSNYPIGYSTWRVTWNINGTSVDGMLVNFRSADGVSYQQVVDYITDRRMSERVSNGASAWREWLSCVPGTLALSNGWTVPDGGRGLTFEKVNGLVHLRGRIANGTTATGTVIATLPAGFRPVFDEYRPVLCGASLNTSAAIAIKSDGTVVAINVPSNAALDLGCTFSTY